MLFDTTFFIDLAEELQARKNGPCQELLLANRHAVRAVSVVTLGEFAVGATETEVRRFFRGYAPRALGRETAIFAGGCKRRCLSIWAKTICGSPQLHCASRCPWFPETAYSHASRDSASSSTEALVTHSAAAPTRRSFRPRFAPPRSAPVFITLLAHGLFWACGR